MKNRKLKKLDEPNHDLDGCCIQLADDECTQDHELPIAKGGLEAKGFHHSPSDVDEELDGCCGWHTDDGEPTNDNELPKSKGGVA